MGKLVSHLVKIIVNLIVAANPFNNGVDVYFYCPFDQGLRHNSAYPFSSYVVST